MLNATIVKRLEITPELIIIGVRPDAGVPNFLPGQYVALGLPGSAPRPENFPIEKEASSPDKLIKRAYSIGSSPLTHDYLEFYVAIVPDGALTSRLVIPREGERVYCAPKITGTFTLQDVNSDANLVLVSTGTGLAPYMSMIRTPGTWTEGRKITLIHGVRYPQDLAYADEIAGYVKNYPLTYIPVVSRGGIDWAGRSGHVQKLFSEGQIALDPSRDHVFLCGNPAMIDETERMLIERGYIVHSRKTPGSLHLEKYW